ncbi:MAG: RNA polymerase sigma factor [Clostridia bacterium]|nr:RNA polymerase sigma factor [Clostridia bacterium]
MRAWARRGTLREERMFSTWLMRIVINECKTLLRKRRRMILLEQLPEQAFQMPADADGNLYAALFSLPEKNRVPLVLSALEGYTLSEIAQMLHLPVNTVKTRVSRARQQLRQEVADDAQ